MKKLFTLFGLLLAFLCAPFLSAQSYYEYSLVKENFNGWTALPAGWSSRVLNGNAGSITIGDSLKFSASAQNGGRGVDIVLPSKRDSAIIYVNFDLCMTSATVARNNALGILLTGTNNNTWMGVTGYQNELITGLFLAGTDKKFHVWNMDIKGPAPASKPDTIVPAFFVGRDFARGAALVTTNPKLATAALANAWCDSINLSTRTNVVYTAKKRYNLLFVMNFTTKKVDITITQKDDPTNTQTLTGLDFVAPAANDFARIGIINSRSNISYPDVTGGSVGNGGSVTADVAIDNLYVYQMVQSLGQADVTVQYQDLEGNTIKTARVEPQQEVGVNYKLLSTDIASFTDGGNYYAYDATSTGGETVSVASGGSTMIVKFKKTPITTGTYVWKGTFSEFWNEVDPNFSTDGANQLGYQLGNGVSFSDASAPIKEVTLNKNLDLGSGNFVVDVPGYTVKNANGEILSGTGSIQTNATTSLGVSTKSKMSVYLNKDTLTVTNAELTNKFFVKDGTTLSPGYTMSTPIEGDGGTFTLLPKVFNYTSAIKNVKKVNYPLQVKGSATTAKMGGMPKLYCTLDSLAEVNVTTMAGDMSIFGSTVNYVNNKVHLGDSVYMAYSETPAATGISYQKIGELSGTKSSKVVGPNIRRAGYIVGGLNTDATFAGTFKPIIIDTYSNRVDFDIEKVGKGTWTLSGNSPDFFGKVNVTAGKLVVNDTLCNGVGTYSYGTTTITTVNKQISEVVVADTATLAGNGFIGALQTTVNGTITGKLTLGGSVSLKQDVGLGGATTIINVNGADIDKITTEGDFNYGGKLIVKVVGDLPPLGDYQIIKAQTYIESGVNGFDSFDFPSADWTFNFTTGVLSYATTGVNYIDANKEILSIDYYDVTGKRISKDAKGFVIMKVKYTDGTSGAYKTFKKTETR